MNTDPKFYNKDGSLTVYSFMCGYIEREDNGDLSCELYIDGLFHVRLFDRAAPNWGNGRGFNSCISCGRFWLSFEKLGDARKLYNKLRTRVRRGQDYTDLFLFDNGEV